MVEKIWSRTCWYPCRECSEKASLRMAMRGLSVTGTTDRVMRTYIVSNTIVRRSLLSTSND